MSSGVKDAIYGKRSKVFNGLQKTKRKMWGTFRKKATGTKKHPQVLSFEPSLTGWLNSVAVNIGAIAQFFTRLKVWNVLTFQLDFIASFRVTPGTWSTIVQRKTTETADFNALAPGKSGGHMLQHLFYGIFHCLGRDMRLLTGKSFNQF